jgi:hypothetical protein
MNEHIKELLFEVVTMEGEDGDLFPSLYTEKQIEEFAELIVRECANVALREDHEPDECILRHFGVKR